MFTDQVTGEIKKVGDRVTIPALAETYRRIAKEGADTFYNGSLRDDIIADLEDIGKVTLLNTFWFFVLGTLNVSVIAFTVET